MAGAVLKKLTIFAPSATLLIIAYLAVPHIATLSPPQQELAVLLPYLIAGTGLILSLAFGRGRVFFLILLVAFVYWSFRNYLGTGVIDQVPQIVFQFLCVLVPINITIFCFMRERGVFTTSGRMRLAFLLLQVGFVAWIIRYRQAYANVPLFLSQHFLDFPVPSSIAVSHLSLLISFVGLLLITAKVIRRKSPIDSGILGVFVAVFLALNSLSGPYLPTVFMAAATLILSVSILQDTHNMAFRDDLTGLPARRALNEHMQSLGKQYVIAMLDVDHFKKFNDTHGHDVGDQVLKMVARKLGAVKGGGRAFRYGGEEFTIIFSRKMVSEAIPFLEEVRKAVEGYELVIRDKTRPKQAEEGKKKRGTGTQEKSVSVTISIGIAESGEGLRTPDEVIKEADKALYRAKNKGRNQLSK